MKKKTTSKPGQKDFATSPFKALKGLQAAAPEPLPAPPARPVAPSPALEDEATLFLRAVAGVKPLGSQASPDGSRQPKPVPKAPAVPPAERNIFLEAVSKLELDVVFTDELPDDVKPLRPAASSRMKQLKRGAIRIDLELDLHGLTREDALRSLAEFIAGAYNRGQKGVLVITGKGNNSPEGPVLQVAVSAWLREQGKTMVAEFSPAPARLGGSGAFVVFLKEKGKNSGQ